MSFTTKLIELSQSPILANECQSQSFCVSKKIGRTIVLMGAIFLAPFEATITAIAIGILKAASYVIEAAKIPLENAKARFSMITQLPHLLTGKNFIITASNKGVEKIETISFSNIDSNPSLEEKHPVDQSEMQRATQTTFISKIVDEIKLLTAIELLFFIPKIIPLVSLFYIKESAEFNNSKAPSIIALDTLLKMDKVIMFTSLIALIKKIYTRNERETISLKRAYLFAALVAPSLQIGQWICNAPAIRSIYQIADTVPAIISAATSYLSYLATEKFLKKSDSKFDKKNLIIRYSFLNYGLYKLSFLKNNFDIL